MQKAPSCHPLGGNSPENALLRIKFSAACARRPKALPLETAAFEKAGETFRDFLTASRSERAEANRREASALRPSKKSSKTLEIK